MQVAILKYRFEHQQSTKYLHITVYKQLYARSYIKSSYIIEEIQILLIYT
jgi:hypothetical protein